LLGLTGLSSKRMNYAGTLGLVDRKKLELARALATKPKLLLLDEVMAGLNTAEMMEAVGFIKKVRDSGVTLVVVEHVMKALFGYGGPRDRAQRGRKDRGRYTGRDRIEC